jgi:hypothetical protein
VLREGEVLLDTFVGDQQSVAFVVTRDACRVVELPGEQALYDLIDLYRSMVAKPDQVRGGAGGTAPSAGGGAKLADLLFAGSEDLIAGSHRMLVAADGVLNVLPIGGFPVAGAEAGTQSAAVHTFEPLLAGQEVVRIPSATVLAWLRRRDPAAPAPSTHGRSTVLAVAGAPDIDGDALEGAVREVRRLGRRFVGVDVRIGAQAGRSLLERDLEGFELLHFAAHTRADDQHPWRSCIVLDPVLADATPVAAASATEAPARDLAESKTKECCGPPPWRPCNCQLGWPCCRAASRAAAWRSRARACWD